MAFAGVALIANCHSGAARWLLWERVTTELAGGRLHGHART